jgi:hypothetical protein
MDIYQHLIIIKLLNIQKYKIKIKIIMIIINMIWLKVK